MVTWSVFCLHDENTLQRQSRWRTHPGSGPRNTGLHRPWGLPTDATPLPCKADFLPLILMQICFLMPANVIGQCIDFYTMIHTCWVIVVLYWHRRKAITEIWPTQVLLLPGLHHHLPVFRLHRHPPCPLLGCVPHHQHQRWEEGNSRAWGAPWPAPPTPHPEDYPWRFKGASFNNNIIKRLYFPDFIVWSNPVFLLCKWGAGVPPAHLSPSSAFLPAPRHRTFAHTVWTGCYVCRVNNMLAFQTLFSLE